MKSKWKLSTAALMCAMVFSSANVYAQDVNSYDGLKDAVKQTGTVNVTGDIEFSETLNIGENSPDKNVNVTIEGNNAQTSGSVTFTQPDSVSAFKRDAFHINEGSSLTVKNANFKDFKGSSGVAYGAVIRNFGKLTITAEEGKDVIFSGNGKDRRGGGGDIYINNNAVTEINGGGGVVSLDAGISGYGKLIHNGQSKLEVGGANSFRGEFTNESGVFEFKEGATPFRGKSVFNAGELHWYTNNNLSSEAFLDIKNNTKLVVGNGVSNANLTLNKNNSLIAKTIDITVNTNGILTLSALGDMAFDNQIKGDGTFVIDNMSLTFDGNSIAAEERALAKSGIGQNIKFASKNNSTINLKNLSDDFSLMAISGENADNNGLTLNISDYDGTADNVKVDGNGIKELNISGKNDKISGKVSISGNGKVLNNADNTEITNGIKIENASDTDDFYSLVNESGKTIVLKGDKSLENSGKINNKGTLKLDGTTSENNTTGVIDNTGSIEGIKLINTGTVNNSGSITVYTVENTSGQIKSIGNGALKLQTLSNGGTVDMTESDGEFSVSGSVSNTGTIKGKKAVFGTLDNNNSIVLSDKLTINGHSDSDDILKNTHGSEITAKEIEVSGGINNAGEISTTGSITSSGKLTNSDNAKLSFSNASFSDVENSGDITSEGSIIVNSSLNNKSTGKLSFSGGTFNNIENLGTITNTGSDLSVSGSLTGSSSDANIINKGGNVSITGDSSGYTGKYTQESGSTTVGTEQGSNAKLFNGEKDIQGGSLTVFSDRLDYQGAVKLGSNTEFNFTNYNMTGGTVSNSVLEFAGTNATASFKGAAGNDKSAFTLNSGIKGSENNNISFDNTELSLASGIDESLEFRYKNFTLKNSVLKLGEQSTEDHESVLRDYIFDNFHSDNSSIDLNIHITNDDNNGYLKSDSLTVGKGSSGTLSLASVFISGEENATRGKNYSTKENQGVIRGEGDVNLSGEGSIKGATTKFTYDVDVNEDGKGLTLKVSGQADSHSLSDMNSSSNTDRFFQFSEGDNTEYHIDESLGKTREGKFTVSGKNSNAQDSVLSGKLVKESQITEDRGNFFDIDSGVNTELTVRNLTVKDADITQDSNGAGGSVLRNNSTDSKVILDNVVISSNSSSAQKGGAVYNNGGSGDPHDADNFKGLYVHNSRFTANKASDSNGLGGALYNDTNGHLILEDVIFDAMSGSSKNDIYNAGTAYAIGSNNFNSDITNKGHFSFHSDNMEGEAGSLISKFNNETEADVSFGGKNTITNLENSGTANFSGDNTINETFKNNSDSVSKNTGNLYIKNKFDNKGKFDNDGYFEISQNAEIVNEDTASNSSITNKGGLLLEGDASKYKGAFKQSAKDESSQYLDDVKTNVLGSFFGGESVIEDGILNWLTQSDINEDATLTVSGGILNIGDGDTHAGKLTFREGSSVSENVQTNIFSNGELGIAGADITLSQGSNWLGSVTLSDGSLTLDSVKSNGKLNASNGRLTLKNETNLYVNENSKIAKEVSTDIQDNSNVIVENNGTLYIDDNDIWNGNVVLRGDNAGTLNIDGYNKNSLSRASGDSNGLLQVQSGNLNITNGANVTLKQNGDFNSFVDRKAVVNIADSSIVNLEQGGELTLNDGDYADTWAGTVNLNGGTLDYAMKSVDGTLQADKGNLNLLEGSVLTIKEPSVVNDDVSVDVQKGSTVDIKSGKFNLDSVSNDKWHGLVKNEGGILTVKGIENSTDIGGSYQQDGGEAVFDEQSKITISGNDSYIKGGNVSVLNNSSLMLGKAVQEFYADKLSMSENSVFDIKNGEIKSVEARQFDVSGKANFTLDINPREKTSDKFIFDNLTTANNAVLNVSNFDFQGGAPIDETVELQLFDGDINGNIQFEASHELKNTPIGYYGLQAMGNGLYRAYLDSINPHTFRGQVATLAAYANQVMVDDIVTNHFMLNEERVIDNAKNVNKYAAADALFAPYQSTYADGGLWAKSYVSFNKFDMTQGLNVGGNVWGTLAGADFPAKEINGAWKFIPTAYIGYNGGHQHFNGVRMNQDGGQVGLMGTFIGHNNFITSITAYGGGYTNDMDVEGYRDNAGNWFTGAAVKSAYNLHPFEDFIFQPNVFVSYNLFGKQNWGTDFGVMSMNSEMLNGINVAPGLNLILAKRTWSLYATMQYMYYINESINGMAGNVRLPNVGMDHGYIQYGLGGTKFIKNKFGMYGQFTVRNAGINGIGLQFGLNYLLGDSFEFPDSTPKFNIKYPHERTTFTP